MSFETTIFSAPVPVTVVSIHGDVDASNAPELVQLVKQLYQDGTRDLLLDLSDTEYISSSGLAALHSIALILNGGEQLDTKEAWSTLRTVGQGLGSRQTHLKLLNVGPRVDRTLYISGLKAFYSIFSDREEALASFQAGGVAPAAL